MWRGRTVLIGAVLLAACTETGETGVEPGEDAGRADAARDAALDVAADAARDGGGVEEPAREGGSPFGLVAWPREDTDWARYVATGAGWVRGGAVPVTLSGAFDWTTKDAELRAMLDHGLQPLAGLSTRGKRLPPDLDALDAFVLSTAARYDGDGDVDDDGVVDGEPLPEVRAWKVGNEPELRAFWEDGPEDYAVLLRHVFEQVRRGHPDALVVTGGHADVVRCGIDEDFWRQVYGHVFDDGTIGGDYLDVINLHVYGSLECVDDVLAAIRALEAELGMDKLLWVSETGTPGGVTMARPATTRMQSEQLVKRFAKLLARGVEKVFWFDVIDWAPQDSTRDDELACLQERWDPDRCDVRAPDAFAFYGLYYHDWTPKPAVTTYRTLVDAVGGFSAVEEVAAGQVRFEVGDRTVWVVWEGMPLAGRVRVTELDGSVREADAAEVDPGGSPLIVEGL